MAPLTRLTLALSRTHPLAYLLSFLIAIPGFAILYVVVAPQGFYAPSARYERHRASYTLQLATILEGTLHRSLDSAAERELSIGDWKLDPKSLRVDDLDSTDGTTLSFRVSFSAHAAGKLSPEKQARWSIILVVPDNPTHALLSEGAPVTTYRVPDVSFVTYPSPFKEEYESLFRLMLGQKDFFAVPTPALALNAPEELQFRHYLLDARGDPSSISGDLSRMTYLSAVVITTLGFGDIVPVTPEARILVATEAITGVVFAGLFLNALAYQAIATLSQNRPSETRESSGE